MRSFPEYRDDKTDDGANNEDGTQGSWGCTMVKGDVHKNIIKKVIVELSNHINEINHSITSVI